MGQSLGPGKRGGRPTVWAGSTIREQGCGPRPFGPASRGDIAQDQNQQDSTIHSLISACEPHRGFQDGVGGSSRPGLEMTCSISGLRNLGHGKLTVNTAVIEYFLNYLPLHAPSALQRRPAGHTPGITCWLVIATSCGGRGALPRPPPGLVPSSLLAATQDMGPHQLPPAGLTGAAPGLAAFLCVIRSIILLLTITLIAWCHF